MTRTVYATDNSIYQLSPAAVALPATTAQVAKLIRDNSSRDEPQPIVARGGGTGTNGQSLTNGLVIDVKRNLNRIIEIDPEARQAVVEPGLVALALDEALAEHGLTWAPRTSTRNRATVGGMLATDAAGQGSLVHGRTHRHVESMEICLNDGNVFVAEPVSIDEAERRATEPGRAGEIWRALLELDVDEQDTFDLPELARGFSGYGIDRLRYDNMIDPLALLIGAEGTLGIVTRATLALTPVPKTASLVVALYPTFAAALEDAVELRSTLPTAIEAFDERTLEAGRSSAAWPALGAVVGDRPGAILALEYAGDAMVDDEQIHRTLQATGRSVDATTISSPAAMSAIWKIRADAVGLIARAKEVNGRIARPTAMVEDCAVPVGAMVDFIADFRDALDGFGVDYAMYGHADVGCVHVRPALDMTDPDHEKLVGQITDAVTATVKKHNGVLWGEHGRGFRGGSATAFLTPDTISLMRQIKSIFDPTDLFNPGKLYRPAESALPLIGVEEPPMRGQIDRSVPVGIRREYASAFACNGNGLCHSHAISDPMCPSFNATGDPALSPKGRADLFRAVLARRAASGEGEQSGEDAAFEDAVADNLSECLSCSACSGTCPVEVDIPELKSRFLESYYETRKRPRSHALLSRFEAFAAIGTRAPWLASTNTKQAGRALGLVDLPRPAKATRTNTHPTFHARKDPGPFDIVLLRDVFTDRLEPDTIVAAADVLVGLELRVALSPFVASGKFDHVHGKRSAFAKSTRAQRRLVEQIVSAGATPVAIEPATALMHGNEYHEFDPTYPTSVRHLVDVLYDNRGSIARSSPSSNAPMALLGHCTERSMRPENLTRWAAVLEAAGYDTSVPDLGCCGMAGLFGHEEANQEMSKTLWNMGWGDVMRGNDVTATGYSCRSQATRFGGRKPPHPIHLLVE